MPSIHDIAQRAGVSAATVSRAFRTPGRLNPEALARVLEVARQMDYEPRATRKRPVSAPEQRRTVGFQFFQDRPTDTLQANPFYGPVLYGAQTEATRLGLNLMVYTADRHETARDLPRVVADWQIDGMLLVGGLPDVHLAELYARHVPDVVLLDNRDLTGRFESVSSDGFGGVFQAMNTLLGMGHRRIAFILPETGVGPFEDRLRGYQWAMQAAGLPVDPALNVTLERDATKEEWDRRLSDLLRQPERSRPTAVLAANDDAALSLLRRCKEWGIRVPEDLSVIGFDDMPVCEHLDPPLTTLRVEKEFMGRLAVRCLHSRLSGSGREASPTEPPVQHIVPVSLVVRGTCRSLL